jgi:hypothetical protein
VAELPGDSRVTSWVDGERTVITIPVGRSGARGCFGGSWGAAAGFGFLAVTFCAQGFFGGNLLWVLGAVGCFFVAAWQLAMLRGIPGKAGRVEISVDGERLGRAVFRGEAVLRAEWMRVDVRKIAVGADGRLCLHLNGGREKVCLISGNDPAELEWIAEQVRLKWKMAGGGLVE